MKHKFDSLAYIRNFIVYVITQFNVKIKRIQSDNGSKFMSDCFKALIQKKKKDIVHETTCPYTPQ